MTDEEGRKIVDILLKSSLSVGDIMKMLEIHLVDKTMNEETKKIIDKTIHSQNGQKMSIGKLVRHRTVPALGLGLVVAESNQYKGYWMIKWCDQRYSDVGHLGIEESYLEIV